MKTTTNTRKALLISFYFPPFFNPGSVRMGKFAKYLPEFGWEPRVLTVNRAPDPSKAMDLEIDGNYVYRTPYFTFGDSLSSKVLSTSSVDSTGKVQWAGKEKPWKTLALKSVQSLRPVYDAPVMNKLIWDPIGWYLHAVKKGREIIAKEKIEVILSTFNPSLPHLIASKLNRQTGIPWVADFRDLWSHNPYVRKTQPFQFCEEFWEKRTLNNCNYLVSVSEPLVKDLEAFHLKKAAVIYNGFDEDDFKEKVELTAKFTITYTGQLLSPEFNPTPLYEALAELKREGTISADNIEVRFFGKFMVFHPSVLSKEYGLEDIVKTHPFVPLSESIKRQKESTVLLHVGWDDPKADGELSSKIFEYLGAGRPVLAIAYKEGYLNSLLSKSGCGVIVNSAGETKEILTKWVGEYMRYGKVVSHYHPNPEVIKAYSRREGTRKLVDIFDYVLNSNEVNLPARLFRR
jgi:hypothetical protein